MAATRLSKEPKLERYERKRDFSRTPEPRGARASSGAALRYVIQKHAARRLHYDLRLEHDGVLKSWAVPKSPGIVPGERRLAVETEDHPLGYAGFEGEIPAGEYGAGSVLIWDRGTWRPSGDPATGLQEGKLDFEIDGERLSGRFTLVRMSPKRGKRPRQPEWLLIKRSDRPRSSGRPMAGAADRIRELPGARRSVPVDARLALATAVTAVPEGLDWLFEPKLDGYRLLCRRGADGVSIRTRSGRDWTQRFAGIADAIAQLRCREALVDGEAVVFGPQGVSDFGRLQTALSRGSSEIVLVAFDLLALDGWDLREVPLERRKKVLANLLTGAPRELRYSEHIGGNGREFFREACSHGLEGIVAKRAGDRYRPGRSRSWLKIKCLRREEFVVVGFTPPGGSRRGFGALLVATRPSPGAPLRYAGKVGTGFSDAMLLTLRRQLEALESKEPTAAGAPAQIAREATWVEPRLVAEVAYGEWTATGRLRHPRFKGLREDKSAAEVVAERRRPPPGSDGAGSPDTAAERLPLRRRSGSAQGRTRVRLTNPDKVLFPGAGITKRELADYWQAVAGRALPLIEARPLMLFRCPDGYDAQCFYQKHIGTGVPAAVPRFATAPDEDPYAVVDSPAALTALVQIGTIELHVWGSRVERLEQPDIIVFDLDPDEGLDESRVIAAAFELRSRLSDLGLVPFVRVTGGKGLHVVVPVEPGPDWSAVKRFTRAVAEEMVREAPRRYTASVSKQRRDGKIFIDYLRNGRGATAIASYSPRARHGAPVALPIGWDELEGARSLPRVGIRGVPERLDARDDPWTGFEQARRSLVE